MVSNPSTEPKIPPKLIEAIRGGTCVAFLGAGFSAAARLPTWHQLLTRLTDRLGDDHEGVRSHIREALNRGGADHLEQSAQLLQNAFGRDQFTHVLRECVGKATDTDEFNRRREWLSGIPFKAILTTNFDSTIKGSLPTSENYRRFVDRKVTSNWLTARGMEDGNSHSSNTPVIKLHGDLDEPETVVFTRSDYRRRVFGEPAYLNFLRSAFYSNTVLFLGFSFTDTYINQLRSEILTLLGLGDGISSGEAARAYAVVGDLPAQTCSYFRDNEGIQILPFDTRGDRGFQGFDDYLEAIYRKTNPEVSFGQQLGGKRILWVDPERDNNTTITRDSFGQAARAAGNQGCEVVTSDTVEDALAKLGAHLPDHFDLVITRYRYPLQDAGIAVPLLRQMRQEFRVPVIVFAGKDEADTRKVEVLREGAVGYYHTFEGLLRALQEVFGPADT